MTRFSLRPWIMRNLAQAPQRNVPAMPVPAGLNFTSMAVRMRSDIVNAGVSPQNTVFFCDSNARVNDVPKFF